MSRRGLRTRARHPHMATRPGRPSGYDRPRLQSTTVTPLAEHRGGVARAQRPESGTCSPRRSAYSRRRNRQARLQVGFHHPRPHSGPRREAHCTCPHLTDINPDPTRAQRVVPITLTTRSAAGTFLRHSRRFLQSSSGVFAPRGREGLLVVASSIPPSATARLQPPSTELYNTTYYNASATAATQPNR